MECHIIFLPCSASALQRPLCTLLQVHSCANPASRTLGDVKRRPLSACYQGRICALYVGLLSRFVPASLWELLVKCLCTLPIYALTACKGIVHVRICLYQHVCNLCCVPCECSQLCCVKHCMHCYSAWLGKTGMLHGQRAFDNAGLGNTNTLITQEFLHPAVKYGSRDSYVHIQRQRQLW